MGRGPASVAVDGCSWGADVVAHVEQELLLGAVCRLLVLERDLQLAVLFFQLVWYFFPVLSLSPISCTERLRYT